MAIKVVERGPRPEPPWLGYPPNAANQIYDGSSPVNPTFVAGPQYIPPPQGQAGLPNVDSSHDAGYASNPAQIPASASDTSGHTLVQTQIPKPSIGEHTAPISQSSSAQAHPLEDNQLVADKYGQTGALGAGIANAVVAISTSSEHNNAPSTMTNDHQSFNGQPAPTAGATTNDQQYSQEHNKESDPSFKRKVYREVPARLPLHPNSRYCEKCELVKPYRAHHCRHCGTCVLGMDHHCPWIGQCCGARNHLYFVVFCFWSCVSDIMLNSSFDAACYIRVQTLMQKAGKLTGQCIGPSDRPRIRLHHPPHRSHSSQHLPQTRIYRRPNRSHLRHRSRPVTLHSEHVHNTYYAHLEWSINNRKYKYKRYETSRNISFE